MPNNIMPGEHDWMYRQPGVMGFPSPPPAAPAQGGGLLGKLGGMFGGGSYGGLLGDDEKKAAQQQALLAMGAQLMAAGGESPTRVSFGQALGPALMAGQQAYGKAGEDALQAMLLKTKLQQTGQKTQKPVAVIDPVTGKPKLVSQKEALGMEPYSAVQRAEAPAVIQEYNLYSKQMQEAGRKPQPYMDWLGDRAKTNVGAPYQFIEYGGGTGLVNRTNPGDIRQISTATEETNAAAILKEAEARAAELAKAQAGRDATFQEDLNVIDDEILRTQRLLTEFRSGKYQTGPLSGRLPNVRTSAQDLSREQGRDTIKAISSATFGALSEGERGFLKELGVSETANEESNINMLDQRLQSLQRAKRRLTTRDRLGVGPNAPPEAFQPAGRPPLSSFQK
jgi:hypothetical protein